jgi:hypothetical protein
MRPPDARDHASGPCSAGMLVGLLEKLSSRIRKDVTSRFAEAGLSMHSSHSKHCGVV